MTTKCLNSACNGATYNWILEKKDAISNAWQNIENLADMTATLLNATNIIIKANSLESNSEYSLKVYVTSLLKTEGFAMLMFKTAGKPHSGSCSASVSEGVSLETPFQFECIQWQDETGQLTYEFRSSEGPISYGASPTSSPTVLPPGLAENDYQTEIYAVITNAVGVSVMNSFIVKVNIATQMKHLLFIDKKKQLNSISFFLAFSQYLLRFPFFAHFQRCNLCSNLKAYLGD